MNMNMNRLPVPTWNHLGVNFAPDKVALPQVPANGCRCHRRRACGHPHQRPGD